MRLRRVGALLVAFGLSGGNLALAQVATTGTIQLVLEDQQGARLAGATASASATDVITVRQGVSDAEGVVTLEALAPSANYVVKAALSGFRSFERDKILVTSGNTTTLHVQLSLSTVTEQVTVTAQATPVVDVTRAVSGTDITLRLTESLPTGRTYQSYLQIVPGVLPDSQTSPGNPASRSGVNWKDNAATDNIGGSTDNAYYFEGINVTDPVTGTFGANLNTEIIQEQKVITGGIPAEYVGAPGLISTVITKSGTNAYSGSYNYFFRNDAFVAANVHNPGATFSTKDTAFTVGGPVLRNTLWGFGSWRYLNTGTDVNASDTHVLLRRSDETRKQGFAKGTWAPSQTDMLTLIFLNDPQTRSSDPDGSVVNSRTRRREQGGNNLSIGYSKVWNALLLEGGLNHHNAAISDFSASDKSNNTILFQTSDVRTLADEQLGGFGQDAPETRPTTQARGAAQYQWTRHTFKGGLEWTEHQDHRNLIFTGPDKAQYTSLAKIYTSAGVSAGSIATGPWSARRFSTATPADLNGFINAINASPNKAAFYAAYDANGDGAITAAELNTSLIFNSTAGNPDGAVNYYRVLQTAIGPQDTKVTGLSFFGQDDFSLSRFTFNVGVRAERWAHFATTGARVFQFPWAIAPRLSAVYDVRGDGTQKVSAFYGRYYDPIRMDMTNVAGTATGAVREQQVFALNQWVTYRVIGGSTINGFFSPNTKTPYTDELQLQYEADLGNSMSASVAYYNRRTRDIFEDFDPRLYTVPSAYGGDITNPNTLFLGWDYFGFNPNSPPTANFLLGTLKGGERNYNGLELVFRKRFADRWQSLASYSHLDTKGNAVSDGNNDYGGDVLWLDPRAPNVTGTIPGTIRDVFKASGSYTTRLGLEFGGSYRWNSGAIVNKTQSFGGRRLPVQVTAPYLFDGVSVAWVADGAVGAVQNPSWGQLDARIQYIRPIGRATAELFVDIFNVTNSQSPVRRQDLAAGSGTTKFGDTFVWLNPRNAVLGARIRF